MNFDFNAWQPPVVEVRVDRQPELGMGVVPLSARIRAYSPRNEKEVRFMVGQAQMVSLAYANSHSKAFFS